MVKAYRTVRRVRVGETLPRQKFNGVCIECSKCTKEGMKCSEVKPLAKFDNRRLVGEIRYDDFYMLSFLTKLQLKCIA